MAIALFATQATAVVACLFAQTRAAIVVVTLAVANLVVVTLVVANLAVANLAVARLAATLGQFITTLQQAWEQLLLLKQRFLPLLPLLLRQPKERSFLKVAALVAVPLDQLLLNQ